MAAPYQAVVLQGALLELDFGGHGKLVSKIWTGGVLNACHYSITSFTYI
jgi:hypothetical protein